MVSTWFFENPTFDDPKDEVRFVAIHPRLLALSILERGRAGVMARCEEREQVAFE